MSIPKIIHQLWKTESLPTRYQALAASWQQQHPEWEYRLWSDEAIRAFVAVHFPDFLATFDGYADNICRADAGRYLILWHFGGLYADLDTECLKPFDALLSNREFVIGLEPSEHLDEEIFQGHISADLLCPTIIASASTHPFWESVMACLKAAPADADVLARTGPLMLNRAHKLYKGPPLSILPAPVFYPFSKREIWSGTAFDIAAWESKTRDALTIHYWDGSWFRNGDEDLAPLPESFPLERRPGTSTERPRFNQAPPLISCLMVTRNRYHLSRHALTTFLAQTYTNSELLIIDDGDCSKLADEITRLNNPRLRFIKPMSDDVSLGSLRNFAVDEARGDYVCQWDDDDLSDPHRLQIQLAAILATQTRASFLKRWFIWIPLQKRAMISTERVWEGSMLCEKAIMPHYPELARGEDTPVMEKICAEHATAHLDIPRLYIYVAHGANTWSDEHFDAHWKATGQRYSGGRYEAIIDELNKHLPLRDYEKTLAEQSAPQPDTGRAMDARAKTHINELYAPERTKSAQPPVLILTPMKDATRFLPRYFELLDRLDYDKSALSLGLIEGDSADATHAMASSALKLRQNDYHRTRLIKQDQGLHLAGARWERDMQKVRRATLARARNFLLSSTLQDEAWVLWLDADLVDYPPDLLARLMAADKDIIVPRCVLPDGRDYDLNSFRFDPARGPAEHPRHMQDGLHQPPRGFGRAYLGDLPPMLGPQSIDSVGGTALLIRADLHRNGLNFPAFSHRGYIETEGLAMMAKDMGHTCWALPELIITHADA